MYERLSQYLYEKIGPLDFDNIKEFLIRHEPQELWARKTLLILPDIIEGLYDGVPRSEVFQMVLQLEMELGAQDVRRGEASIVRLILRLLDIQLHQDRAIQKVSDSGFPFSEGLADWAWGLSERGNSLVDVCADLAGVPKDNTVEVCSVYGDDMGGEDGLPEGVYVYSRDWLSDRWQDVVDGKLKTYEFMNEMGKEASREAGLSGDSER